MSVQFDCYVSSRHQHTSTRQSGDEDEDDNDGVLAAAGQSVNSSTGITDHVPDGPPRAARLQSISSSPESGQPAEAGLAGVVTN